MPVSPTNQIVKMVDWNEECKVKEIERMLVGTTSS
jgi:hypothetical protein